MYASGHAKSYPPSTTPVGDAEFKLWYHHIDTSGGTHSGDPATPLWYSGALMNREPDVSRNSDEHSLGADHAVVRGRYETTVPEVVIGP